MASQQGGRGVIRDKCAFGRERVVACMDRSDADAYVGFSRCSEVEILYFQHSFPHPYVAPAPYLGELQNCMLSFFPRRRSPNSICAFTLHPPLSGPFIQPLTYDEGRYIKEVAKDPNRAVFPDW